MLSQRVVSRTLGRRLLVQSQRFSGGVPGGITNTEKFKEVYHNTDSIDGYYEKVRKPRERIDPTKRATQYLVVGATRAIVVMVGRLAILRFCQYWSAAADVLAMSTTEVELGKIPVGTTYVAKWRGSPVFVTHRNPEDIQAAIADDHAELRDPETDAERCPNPEWFVGMAVCTHFGCVPIAGQGGWGGYFCPCHGSHYDHAGRVRKGPAPLNLPIPPYKFLDAETLLIG